MKDNIDNLVYYIFYIPALVISAVFLNLIIPVSDVLSRCISVILPGKPTPQAGHHNASALANNLSWSEAQKAADRCAFNISSPQPVIHKKITVDRSDDITPDPS